MSAIQSVREWLRETTPRWVSVALVVWMGGATLMYGEDLMDRQKHQAAWAARQACAFRAHARSDVREALLDVYDFIDEQDIERGEEPTRTVGLRERLERNFPPLNPADC